MPDAAPQRKTPPKAPAIAALIALVGLPLYAQLQADTKADEGEVHHAYRDLGGVWTICRGTTRSVKPGQTATTDDCDAMTAADLVIAVKGVEACAPILKYPVLHSQLRAAVRMNNNTGAFCKGWWKNRPSPAQLMRGGDLAGGCQEMLRYDLVKGKQIPGLTARRKREVAMCMEGLV